MIFFESVSTGRLYDCVSFWANTAKTETQQKRIKAVGLKKSIIFESLIVTILGKKTTKKP
jgi:hypothetical protein